MGGPTLIYFGVCFLALFSRSYSQAVCELPDYFQCDDGQCIDGDFVCDDWADCDDGSDEGRSDCPNGCWIHKYECPDGSGCQPAYYLCDDENDCKDGSDENCDAEGNLIKADPEPVLDLSVPVDDPEPVLDLSVPVDDPEPVLDLSVPVDDPEPVLDLSVPVEETCINTFWIWKERHAEGGIGVQEDIQTIDDCLNKCRVNLDCIAADYNYREEPWMGMRCWLHINELGGPKNFNDGCTHYVKIPCGEEEEEEEFSIK